MVSLPIDFVSHPKIPFSLRSETSKTGGSVSLFREKKFRYVSLKFRFEAKFGDTLVPSESDYLRGGGRTLAARGWGWVRARVGEGRIETSLRHIC